MVCSNWKMPCFKFTAALLVTVGGLSFGCTMLALGRGGELTAFYTSLISSCISFWCQPPQYNESEIQMDLNHI